MNISFAKPSRKYLTRCGNRARTAIIEAIEGLPEKGDIQMLRGQTIKNACRLRVGRYRVVYIWEKDKIKILDIDTRGDIYK